MLPVAVPTLLACPRRTTPRWLSVLSHALYQQHRQQNVPQSFFLIGDTFYFDDRVEDAERPQCTVAAVVARMLHRRNIGFAPAGAGGKSASSGRSGGTDDDDHKPMREDGLPVHEASVFWNLSRPRWPGCRGAPSLSSSLPPSSLSSSSRRGTGARACGSTDTGGGSARGGDSGGALAPSHVVARIGDFAVRGMCGVTFASLDIQLGAQYLYFHQGNCEHAFCFVDVRAHHRRHHHNGGRPTSAAASSGGGGGGRGRESGGPFPRMVFRNKPVQRTCSVCSVVDVPSKGVPQSTAKFVTFDDRLAGARARPSGSGQRACVRREGAGSEREGGGRAEERSRGTIEKARDQGRESAMLSPRLPVVVRAPFFISPQAI
jgi:hypothetical protein